MAKAKVIEFWEFCEKVLKLKLTTGQRVIAKVAFGSYNPKDLSGEERDIALQLFNGVEQVDDLARKYVVMRLGRGSGKTTLCSAFAVYTLVTFDCSRAGPGSVPYVIVVAPTVSTAKMSVRMAKEMIMSNPALSRLVTVDQSTVLNLRRPDGRTVAMEAFAASTKGDNVRGRDIMAFLFDEAEFFTSNQDQSAERDYAVNDKEIFDAMTPRLMPGAKGMLISTPWPIETLMSKMFEENWGKAIYALAIKAPTILVRGDDPYIVKIVEDEQARDPDNAQREFFCELEGLSSGTFFEFGALNESLKVVDEWPVKMNPAWPTALGCDLGFTRDSSAIVVVQYDGKYYRTIYTEEMKPKPGKPLKPKDVIAKIAKVARDHGLEAVVADQYYREALREHLDEHNLGILYAPEGTKGKADVFQRARRCLHDGLCVIPKTDINKRMVAQAKLVTSKAAPGGTVSIKIPRRVGMGHGDIVSAWVLAVWELAYREVKVPTPEYTQDQPEFNQELTRRINAYLNKQQDEYLKKIEKEGRKRLGSRYKNQFGSIN